MRIQQAYDTWAASYDTAPNKIRDLEARAIRAVVPAGSYAHVVELGAGTGKNTAWLATLAQHLTAVDFSAAMLQQARQKLPLPHITFQQADLTQPWPFAPATVDLLTCSLTLEHILHLDGVFAQAALVLRASGLFYIGELHPFKQYQGSKARVEQAHDGAFEVEGFVHHVSDFVAGARHHGLTCESLLEWFDEDDRSTTPRVVSFLFRQP